MRFGELASCLFGLLIGFRKLSEHRAPEFRLDLLALDAHCGERRHYFIMLALLHNALVFHLNHLLLLLKIIELATKFRPEALVTNISACAHKRKRRIDFCDLRHNFSFFGALSRGFVI